MFRHWTLVSFLFTKICSRWLGDTKTTHSNWDNDMHFLKATLKSSRNAPFYLRKTKNICKDGEDLLFSVISFEQFRRRKLLTEQKRAFLHSRNRMHSDVVRQIRYAWITSGVVYISMIVLQISHFLLSAVPPPEIVRNDAMSPFFGSPRNVDLLHTSKFMLQKRTIDVHLLNLFFECRCDAIGPAMAWITPGRISSLNWNHFHA